MKNLIWLTLLVCLATLVGCRNEGNINYTEGPGIKVSNGLVVSAHSESSRIGAMILARGGNAIDAAVATELALAVCYPEAGNIGGGGFMVIRTSDGKHHVIDYREKAPLSANRDMYLDKDGKVIEGLSTNTHLASGVPGSVDGILNAHSKFGRLPFSVVIQPAIDLAEKGYPLPAGQAASFNSARKDFIERNDHQTAFVKDSLWKPGDIFRQPELAATLKLIRDKGRDGFYSGITADLIEKEMKRGNGILTTEDLAGYHSQWREPLEGSYRGYKIVTVPPPSSGGLILLQILGMIENESLAGSGFHTTSSVHRVIEAERRAFADRAEFMGDPDFVNVPVKGLLNPGYLAHRMSDFDPARASLSSEVGHGNPEAYVSEETTHYSVADKEGNMVATTTTLNGTFGNCIVVKGAGFLLNNQMDDFSSKPGFPNMYGLVGGEANSIKPGKRMLSSMTPVIIEKDNKPYMVVGSPGGSTIPTSVLQVISNVVDFNMPMQEAVNAARFHHQWLPDLVAFERTQTDSIPVKDLEAMGYILKKRNAIGRVNAIRITADGFMEAGADPRGDNTATGY